MPGTIRKDTHLAKYSLKIPDALYCNGPETPTLWKSESVTDLPTYQPTNQLAEEGSRDACASKNRNNATVQKSWLMASQKNLPINKLVCLNTHQLTQ